VSDPVPSDVEIRLGVPGDAEGIAALIERENHRPADRAMIARRLADVPSAVAEQRGELVGFFYGRRFAPQIVEMQNMLLARRIRRQGVGRRMVEVTENALYEAGYRVAIGANSLLHPQANPERCTAARAFWLKMGWRIALATGATVLLVRWLPSPADRNGEPAGIPRGARGCGRTLCGLSPARDRPAPPSRDPRGARLTRR
jgi:GNAT superfamily N-acetyltransferase